MLYFPPLRKHSGILGKFCALAWLLIKSRKNKEQSSATICQQTSPWWRHQLETFSALLALCAWNSPVTGEFPSQRPVTRTFDDFFDLRLIKRLSKRSRRWWFETPSWSLWRHCNATITTYHILRKCSKHIVHNYVHTFHPSNIERTTLNYKLSHVDNNRRNLLPENSQHKWSRRRL